MDKPDGLKADMVNTGSGGLFYMDFFSLKMVLMFIHVVARINTTKENQIRQA